MRFILATRNRHKLAEYRAILAPHEVEPMPDGVALPPEGAESFAANARA
jgi:inosine/xanthosine triphosphate pyrophosphatase family protein